MTQERINMRAEIGAESPFWTPNGVMIWVDSLPLSAQLQSQLVEWAVQYLDGEDGWLEQGKLLLARVSVELGADYDVRWAQP